MRRAYQAQVAVQNGPLKSQVSPGGQSALLAHVNRQKLMKHLVWFDGCGIGQSAPPPSQPAPQVHGGVQIFSF
jgi:hypothetical protein